MVNMLRGFKSHLPHKGFPEGVSLINSFTAIGQLKGKTRDRYTQHSEKAGKAD